ncbi:MAG TPA: Hsp20/alpha crystallin family protein [Vitreimonas sp.]|jgi:HSP20 family protein|nr:Hsp20/alpha crystallin family protein [Vitreimonas sp.]
MALTRVNPLQDFTPLWDVMDRFITDSFATPRDWSNWATTAVRSMPLEVYETPDQFIVRAFAPGVMPEQLSVEYDAGTLTIRAKTEVPELEEGWKPYLAEFPYGEFVRQLRLPRKVDVDGIQSTFEHGVLTLAMPKVAEARPHRIEIRTPAQLGSGGTENKQA